MAPPTLTPEQRRALDTAHRALVIEKVNWPLQTDGYWRGYLREALLIVADAFDEGDDDEALS